MGLYILMALWLILIGAIAIGIFMTVIDEGKRKRGKKRRKEGKK